MHAAERGFFTFEDFAVAAFVHFAAAVSANVKAGLNGNADQVGETFEQTFGELLAFFCEFKDFLLFFAHRLVRVLDQAFLFKLLQEGVNEARADFFSKSLFESSEYAVAVSWSLV